MLAGGALAFGNPWLNSQAHLIAMVVTVALLSLLLPLLGIMGAAIATVIASWTQLAVVAYGLRQTHGISLIGLLRFNWTDLLATLNISELVKGQRERLAPDQS